MEDDGGGGRALLGYLCLAAGVFDGAGHRLERAAAVGVRLADAVGVERRAVAGHLRVHARAPRHGIVETEARS